MRVEPDYLRFKQDWTHTLPNRIDGRRQLFVHRLKPRPVQVECPNAKALGDAVDFGAGLRRLRYADGVAVVLHQIPRAVFHAQPS